ncbi:MAG: FxsA family protein [Amylibacter sp.]|nr:FxsA family protein [Amylibacter sp.]|tara:strand:- start:771 stop:1265 length:495 start_codon:yes stop_codon:yes gene_type:complete
MLMLFIFIAVPIIEIALFIKVGGFIGLYPTLAIVLLTAFIGTSLLRSQGMSAFNGLQNSIMSGQNPMSQIAHGAMILIAGVVLLTPGFFTDAVGLALLIPGVRTIIIKAGAAKIASKANMNAFNSNTAEKTKQSDVYDADFTVVNEENESNKKSNHTNNQIDKE